MLHGFAIQNQADESLNILLLSKALAESDFHSQKLHFNLVLNIYFLSWKGILWTLQIFNPSLLGPISPIWEFWTPWVSPVFGWFCVKMEV